MTHRTRASRSSASGWPVLGGLLALGLFAVLGLLGWQALARSQSAPLSAAEFRSLLEAGQVERVVVRGEVAQVSLQGQRRTHRLAWPDGRPGSPDGPLLRALDRQDVEVRFEQRAPWLALLLGALPPLLALALFVALPLTLLGLLLWRLRVARPGQR
ncbi:hypothetical protein [Deinococcus arcticus]|uniref:Peptidase M41 FtsH extracellular domain-containing protein n=1 Tax=Deinococcus arcticus TaxID=2136176 RepID=A0A2T3WAB1_9DEIO|nr:hypothetical protein [Deinococcus arcticus]PTA68762.1 hypothetical protein C8263_05845 [Deinococcus arcticus]